MVYFLRYDIFELEALASLLFAVFAIVDLFFGKDLTIVLDFTVFLTDSLVLIVASIKHEDEEKG